MARAIEKIQTIVAKTITTFKHSTAQVKQASLFVKCLIVLGISSCIGLANNLFLGLVGIIPVALVLAYVLIKKFVYGAFFAATKAIKDAQSGKINDSENHDLFISLTFLLTILFLMMLLYSFVASTIADSRLQEQRARKNREATKDLVRL